MRESFVKDLHRKPVPQSKVAIVMAAAMSSCSSAILGIERFTGAFARKVYEQRAMQKK